MKAVEGNLDSGDPMHRLHRVSKHENDGAWETNARHADAAGVCEGAEKLEVVWCVVLAGKVDASADLIARFGIVKLRGRE